MIDVKIKRLSNTAILPTYGTKDSAGMDLYLDLQSSPTFWNGNPRFSTDENQNDVYLLPQGVAMLSTGVSISIPDGYVGLIYARSGLASKSGVRPRNAVGVVDSDYRGAVMVPLVNDSEDSIVINQGERIAQMIITPYEQANLILVDELDSTERGSGGFGSTGK